MVTCLACQQMQDAMEAQAEVIGGLERELRGKRLTISRLEKELAEAMDKHPLAREARECFDFWNREVKNGRAKGFSGKRKSNVLARLSDKPQSFTVEDIKRGCLGAKHDAFVGGNGVRHDDIELICRDPAKLQSFIDRYDAWERQQPREERVAEPSSTYVPELALAAENVVLHEENEQLRRLLEREERMVWRASELLSQEPALLAKLLNRGATVTDIASRRVA